MPRNLPTWNSERGTRKNPREPHFEFRVGGIHAGETQKRFDGKCHRKSDRLVRKNGVRVKRGCKRPPRQAQARRHGKPHRVQGQIGNSRSGSLQRGEIRRIPGMAAETNDSLRSQKRRQNSAYSSSKIISLGRAQAALFPGAPVCNRLIGSRWVDAGSFSMRFCFSVRKADCRSALRSRAERRFPNRLMEWRFRAAGFYSIRLGLMKR